MIRDEAIHRYVVLSAARRIDSREETPEEMLLLRIVDEFSPEAFSVENVLKND